MRLRLTEPAKWYPGTFLAGEVGCEGSFGLVRVTTPAGTTMEVLPSNRILEHYEHTENAIRSLVKRNEFAKEQVALPIGIFSGMPSPGLYKTSSADQHLVDCLNVHNTGVLMLATHIDGSILHVLKDTDRGVSLLPAVCPKLEGETLLRMLGVQPQDYSNAKRQHRKIVVERIRSPL